MRKTPWTILTFAFFLGCSTNDFLGYRENTGLMVLEPPDGTSSSFGMRLAPSRWQKDENFTDFVAVAGDEGTNTVFFDLARDGNLVDPDGGNKRLGSSDVEDYGASAALATLDAWEGGAELSPQCDGLCTGCVAVGLPRFEQSGLPFKGFVKVACHEDHYKEGFDEATQTDLDDEEDIFREPANGEERFGQLLASVTPKAGGPSLLLVASDQRVYVLSRAVGDDVSPIALFGAVLGGLYTTASDYEIVGLAAGRLVDERIYFAVASKTTSGGGKHRVHVFFQQPGVPKDFTATACVQRADYPGFGTSMTTGDLDGDGSDELLIAAGWPVAGESKGQVHLFAPADLENGATVACADDSPAPKVTLLPQDFPDKDVTCSSGCDYGMAMAVGDIATDDASREVIIGAPRATVDGAKNAGAVYIYRGNEVVAGGAVPVSVVVDSYPEDEQWGGGVAVVPIAGRNELVIGATNSGRAIVAFCTGVGDNIINGGDVPHGGDDNVVSTRCRL